MREVMQQALNELRKAGEGSRGGHIIGHTRRGKPIYSESPTIHSIRHKDYLNWTSHDHDDAAATHREHLKRIQVRKHRPEAYSKELANTPEGELARRDARDADYHSIMSNRHEIAAARKRRYYE